MSKKPFQGFTGTSTPIQPHTITIRREPEPYSSTRFAYRAYYEDNTPMYIGDEELAVVIQRVKMDHPQHTIILPIDSRVAKESVALEATDDERAEVRAILVKHGYNEADGKKLSDEGIGPHELEHRLATTTPGEVGSLEYTHGIHKVAAAENVSQVSANEKHYGVAEPIAMMPVMTPGLLMEGKQPTYRQAQTAIFDKLTSRGWAVNRLLKVPHATNPNGDLRLWFKPQAVWYTTGSHSFGDARSTWVGDIRTMTPDAFVSTIDRMFSGRYALENPIASDHETFGDALEFIKKDLDGVYISGKDDQFYVYSTDGDGIYQRRSLFLRANNWHVGDDEIRGVAVPSDAHKITTIERMMNNDVRVHPKFNSGHGVAESAAEAPGSDGGFKTFLGAITYAKAHGAIYISQPGFFPSPTSFQLYYYRRDNSGFMDMRHLVEKNTETTNARWYIVDTGMSHPKSLPSRAVALEGAPLMVTPLMAPMAEPVAEDGAVCGPFMRIEIDRKRFDACGKIADRLGKINTSKKIFSIAREQMQREPDEIICVMAIDIQMKFRCFSQIHQGSLDRVDVSMRSVAKYAIAYGLFYEALGIVLLHQHPSGDPTPSAADDNLTDVVFEMCKANGLYLMDHVVIGAGEKYYSYADAGKIPGSKEAGGG